MRYGSRIWMPAVLGLGTFLAPMGAATAVWAAADHPSAHGAAARASANSSHHARRVSSKTGHARHRKGTDTGEPDKALAGEKAGGGRGHASARKTKDAPAPSHQRVASVRRPPKVACTNDPVVFERGFGGEVRPLVLTRCNGRPAPQVIEQLSLLVRPLGVPEPTVITTPVRHGTRQEWIPGVKLVNGGMVSRLQKVADHFKGKRIVVVSGYRPGSQGSFHQSARAVDFHVDGVTNASLVAFCRTLPDTGCGYYPNSSFIHMDVRPPSTGKVYWIDASGPGESPRYVASWPPRDLGGQVKEIPRPDPAAPEDEQTHPDSTPPLPPGASDTKVDAKTTAPDVFRP
jgi:hypothetical protein